MASGKKLRSNPMKSIAQTFLTEFEIQAPLTRKFLERLPEDKLTFKPTEKCMTSGQLAYHLAIVPAGIVRAIQSDVMEAPDFQFPEPKTVADILKAHDEGVALVRELLPKMTDENMNATWRLMHQGHEIMATPRRDFVRDVMFSHWYQHRGQFSVHLHMLGLPVPATWGPSADEPPLFMQKGQAA
jgi:uncharacterized damage-inducible protein DinB